jgi:hypothetical protein
MTDTRSRIENIDTVKNFVDGYRSAIEHGAAALGASDAAKAIGIANVGVTVTLESGEVAAGFKSSPQEGMIQTSGLAGTLAGAYAGATWLGPKLGAFGAQFGPKGAVIGTFAGGVFGAVGGGYLGELGVETLARYLTDQRPAWEPDDVAVVDQYLREQIARDLISGNYDHRYYVEAHQQVETALQKGYSPRQIADAIKTGAPGAIRDLYNESYFGDVPTHRPARTNDGVKNDTYNGQNSGPNRGLGDGGNKPDGSYFSDLGGGGGGGGSSRPPSSSPPSSSSDGSYFSDLGGGNNRPPPGRLPSSSSDGSYFSDLVGGGNDGGGSGGGSNKPGGGGSNGSYFSDLRGRNNRPPPILVDLDGDGIEITELSRSNVFMDSAGDGLLHRTAWAGAGDGVLFFDANGDNKIGETREYVFTEWDPTAASDLAALRSAFDTNGDGRRTSTP